MAWDRRRLHPKMALQRTKEACVPDAKEIDADQDGWRDMESILRKFTVEERGSPTPTPESWETQA